uniref:Uncharacterized protein n=1 Tax=Lotus japonicus TaxID=34305 RepID=I3SM83_LOTJA|nr:unknown [Lotus japonicus]
MVSNNSSGSMSGLNIASQAPYKDSDALPATTKSFASSFAPIQSIVQMNGLSSSPNPAITGWQKYGPNRFS